MGLRPALGVVARHAGGDASERIWRGGVTMRHHCRVLPSDKPLKAHPLLLPSEVDRKHDPAPAVQIPCASAFAMHELDAYEDHEKPVVQFMALRRLANEASAAFNAVEAKLATVQREQGPGPDCQP